MLNLLVSAVESMLNHFPFIFIFINSSRGTYGLWFDADLYHGRTCPSKTFDNVRLSSKEDFIIASVEVWTFID
jgi:hypothetical protein